MSGPVSTADVEPEPRFEHAERCELEIFDGREAQVGSFRVHRVLPRRSRRTVGAWCFMDHMGPGRVTRTRGLDVGPHPHAGLQTVTWLLAGEVLHRDSLGSEQVILPRPAQPDDGRGRRLALGGVRGACTRASSTGCSSGWRSRPTRGEPPAFEHRASCRGSIWATVRRRCSWARCRVWSRRPGAHRPRRRRPPPARRAVDARVVPSHEYAVSVLEGSVAVRGHR